ncbi:LPD29 domain-containing protein [Streptomyces sp. NPDC047525]|uniref:LPD29 domain-containing protein n=1 Tax=Streptomyces sp. NPDC047525 TaxID=3155264 RepID=UPI0033C699F1
MSQYADLFYGLPASHNAFLAPPPQREAVRVTQLLRACWQHSTSDERFAREFPADESGRIKPTAHDRAWRYEILVDGRRVIVRQLRDEAQPTMTVDGHTVPLPDLSSLSDTMRTGKIADLIHAALSAPRLQCIEPKAVAALLRQQLKTRFPGHKFSVRSTSRGTARHWVSLSWTDGPTCADMEEILAPLRGFAEDEPVWQKTDNRVTVTIDGREVTGWPQVEGFSVYRSTGS